MHVDMMIVLLHAGRPVAPHDLAGAWSFDPVTIVLLVTSAFLYFRGLHALWARAGIDAGIRKWQAGCFAAGWLTLLVALVSPLHELGAALFSAHMAQHTLLIAVAAPLLVLGRPLVPALWAVPMQWRRRAGVMTQFRSFRVAWVAVTTPAVAWIFHAAALWVWHLPVPYQAALASNTVHALQHVSFLGTALLFWWTLGHGRETRMSYGLAVLYLFTTAMHTGGLGALLTFAGTPWYPAYSGPAAAWGLTALEDQQLAGLIMWVPAGISYLVAALILVAAWLRESERRAVRWRTSVAIGACAVSVISGCGIETGARRNAEAASLTGGDPARGAQLIRHYGCGACHTIPGVTGANGLVGPPLSGIASRMYIAGVLQNSPAAMTRWIMEPRTVDPKTAMPDLDVTVADADDIAAYLYTLK
jgi:putative membrane protein